VRTSTPLSPAASARPRVIPAIALIAHIADERSDVGFQVISRRSSRASGGPLRAGAANKPNGCLGSSSALPPLPPERPLIGAFQTCPANNSGDRGVAVADRPVTCRSAVPRSCRTS
jgi:hypothetical protein